MANVLNVADYVNAIVQAKVTQGGDLIRDGKYNFAIKRFLIEKSSDPRKKGSVWFKAELFVITSEAKIPPSDMMRPGEVAPTPNQVGSTATVICDVASEIGQGNAKALLCGLFRKTVAEADADPTWFGARITEAIEGKYIGVFVGCETFRKLIKSGANAGKPMVGYGWLPVDQTPEEQAAARAMIEGAKK